MQAITPILFEITKMKRKTSRPVACKRDNFHFLRYVVISPEAEIRRRILVRSIAETPLDIFLIIFGGNQEEDQ